MITVAGDDLPPLAAGRQVTLDQVNELGHREPPADPVRIWLTGTGTPAPLPGRRGPSNLLQLGEQLVVVDVGNGAAFQLAQLGFHPREVDVVAITHHHFDHNVDLAYFLLAPWAQKAESRPPTIVGPPGTLRYVDRVLAAHDYDIRVRQPHGFHHEDLEPPVVEIEDGDVVLGRGWSMTAVRVDHHPVDQAFGYRFDVGPRSVAFSGDTRPCDNLVERFQGVDILVHEAIYPGFGIPDYHTLASDVGRVASRAGAGKLVLTHLLPGDRTDEDWLHLATQGFDGPVVVGRDLMELTFD